MSDQNRSGTGGLTEALLVIVTLVLLGGVGMFVVWWRSAETARAQAILAQEQARLAAAQAMAARDSMEAQVAVARKAGADSGETESAIRQVLQLQTDAWNAGDINRFMETYWKSDQLTFSSGGKLTRSWQTTLGNYKAKYATPAEMGKLTFENLEVMPLGAGDALVLGNWHLQRETEPNGGNFSLVFRRIDGQWVIVHDHTSKRTD